MKNFSEKSIHAATPTAQAEIEALKRYGWTDDEIASMTPAQRRAEFQDAMGIDDIPREQAVDQAVSARGSPGPEAGEPDGPEAATGGERATPEGPTCGAPTEQTEIEVLKRYGWDDEDIAAMSPSTRREEFQKAMASGQSESTAELAPRRGNPSKPVEGAPRIRPTKSLRGKLFYGGLSVIFFFAIFRLIFEQQEETTQIVAGWDGISQCSFTSSFDGKKHLSLSENHFARIEGPDQASVDGSWSFDESSSKYTITVRNDPSTYSVVTPGDGANCMLIKGDPGTADLPQSWFYSRADLEDQIDTGGPER